MSGVRKGCDEAGIVKKTIFVIAGGALGDPARFRECWERRGRPPLICADSGARHLQPLGLVPELIIGDMDSLEPALQAHFTRAGSRFLRYPVAKDETDTQLALEYACQAGADEIRIYGAMGSRIDHTLGNISLLALGLKHGVRTVLVDEHCEVFLVRGRHEISGEAGEIVSIFPFGERAEGITLEGFAYPLHEATLEIGSTLGVSNLLTGETAVVTVAGGVLLVVHYAKAAFEKGDRP
jgi:thiamine pyrophosphokinase